MMYLDSLEDVPHASLIQDCCGASFFSFVDGGYRMVWRLIGQLQVASICFILTTYIETVERYETELFGSR